MVKVLKITYTHSPFPIKHVNIIINKGCERKIPDFE